MRVCIASSIDAFSYDKLVEHGGALAANELKPSHLCLLLERNDETPRKKKRESISDIWEKRGATYGEKGVCQKKQKAGLPPPLTSSNVQSLSRGFTRWKSCPSMSGLVACSPAYVPTLTHSHWSLMLTVTSLLFV